VIELSWEGPGQHAQITAAFEMTQV
jgi:hypothetical protein